MKNLKRIIKFIGCASIVTFSIIASTAYANCFTGQLVIDKTYTRFGEYVWLFTNNCNKKHLVYIYENDIMVQTTYLLPGQSEKVRGGFEPRIQRWRAEPRN